MGMYCPANEKSRNGKPVASTESSIVCVREHLMRRPLSQAPMPYTAVNSSSRLGSYTTPITGVSSARVSVADIAVPAWAISAIDTA
ncbi:hypothetical protein G6F62_014341 [Rhizopus arrhizus]|nr:hypothetical protein G6F62_014341 [Rhizopus arrhizus]KAG1316697.1 hypothetical protein G6F63_015964 [Rhizopus arrhizus]